ncbi:MAG: rod-binding protein [Alphaproteobacteria bacterium]|nr:rod-binding protein [Alphaproteobacteria bacterium]
MPAPLSALPGPVPASAAAPVQVSPALVRTAREFEAMVMGELMQPVFAGLASKGPFTGGAGEAAWRPLLVQEFGRALAGSGGLGIADAMLRQLARQQEVQP